MNTILLKVTVYDFPTDYSLISTEIRVNNHEYLMKKA